MRRFFDRLDRTLRAITVFLVLAMLAILALQVGMRYLGGRALSWSEELALLAFTWVIMLASALGIRHGLHARMSALPDALPRAWAHATQTVASLLVALLGAVIALTGWDYVQESHGMTSASIGYPIELLYAAAPAFGALIALFALERAVLGPVESRPVDAAGNPV